MHSRKALDSHVLEESGIPEAAATSALITKIR